MDFEDMNKINSYFYTLLGLEMKLILQSLEVTGSINNLPGRKRLLSNKIRKGVAFPFIADTRV